MTVPTKVLPGQPIVPLYDEAPGSRWVKKYVCGTGTTCTKIRFQNRTVEAITATIIGKPEIVEEDQEMTEESENGQNKLQYKTFKVSVVPSKNSTQKKSTVLPKEGDIVLCRVVKIGQKQANVEILSVDGENLGTDSGIGAVTGLGDYISINGVNSQSNVGSSNMATLAATNSSLNSLMADIGENFKGLIRVQDVRATEKDKVNILESFAPSDIIRARVISIGDGMNYYLSTAENSLGVVFARSLQNGELMYAVDYETMVAPQSGLSEKRKCAKVL